jgi:hypothetical protein
VTALRRLGPTAPHMAELPSSACNAVPFYSLANSESLAHFWMVATAEGPSGGIYL